MRVFAAVQPAGTLHLGNLLAVIEPWQNSGEEDSWFMLADAHGVAYARDSESLRADIEATAAYLIAQGIGTDKGRLFLTSDVPQLFELSWLLDVLRAFREPLLSLAKGSRYPYREIAEILAMAPNELIGGPESTVVVELAARTAQVLNESFGCSLVTPVARSGVQIMDLQDPSRKMGKGGSPRQGTIYLTDSPSVIEAKIAAADATTEGVGNLRQVLTALGATDASSLAEPQLKRTAAPVISERLQAIQRVASAATSERRVSEVLAEGAVEARAVASAVLSDVRRAVGLRGSTQ